MLLLFNQQPYAPYTADVKLGQFGDEYSLKTIKVLQEHAKSKNGEATP